MIHRRGSFQLLWGAGMTGFFGASALVSVISNPRFATIHVLDVMRLMIAGAGLALALFMLLLFYGGGPRVEDDGATKQPSDDAK